MKTLSSAPYLATTMLILGSLGAQAQATGDSRTVVEPIIPAVTCKTLTAPKFIVSTNAVNVDPWNATCGSTGGTYGVLGCKGGTSFEPSSSVSTYAADETLDNTAIQAALNSCPQGQKVELAQGASGQAGFILKPVTIPSGVTLFIDAGVTVFGSRNLSDWGGTNCGIVTSQSSHNCTHWFQTVDTSTTTTPAWGVMGYGVIDGRGWDTWITTPSGQTTSGFYASRTQAYCNINNRTPYGSPACTNNGLGGSSYGPNMFQITGHNYNFTLYKITLKDSGNFFINWEGGNGFTAWGTKLISPFDVPNTDGWDPLDSTNGTFTHGYISNGDNHTALKATHSPVSNITVSYTQTGAGVGLALGTDVRHGISNVLFDHINQNGNLNDSLDVGLELASSLQYGGPVDNITWQNVCMVNEYGSIKIFPNYPGTGSLIPLFTNLYLKNIHVLQSTAPYTPGNSGRFSFQGYDSSHKTTITLDNIFVDGVNQGMQATDQDVIATVKNHVDSSIITQLNNGTGDTVNGTSVTGTAYPCTTSTWKPLIGELIIKSPTADNLTTYNAPGTLPSFTLKATVIPATAISKRESPEITKSISFYDNGNLVGIAPVSVNGTLATLNLSNVASGTHNYTAAYPGDSYYPVQDFGSVTVNVPTGAAPPPNTCPAH